MNAYTEPNSAPQMLSREQAADLLQRYPHVSNAEARLVLAFLRNGRHLDVGLLTADRALKPQLDMFMDDHRRHLRLGFGEVSAVIAGIAALLGLFWFIWEAIKPASVAV